MSDVIPDQSVAADRPRRVALLLQGPPGRFWRALGDALDGEGVRVLKVHFCLADRLFWGRPGAVDYRGRLRGFRRWLRALIRREGVTDILYYADRMPYHRLALKAARSDGIAAHAIEFGYLRPDWLTLEREGGGAYSHFPADDSALDAEAGLPDMRPRHKHAFATEAFWEVAFNLAIVAGRPLYPLFYTDRYYAIIPDYVIWLRKLALGPIARRRAARAEAALQASGAPFWLVALQLQSDYQLRDSAPYAHQTDAIREILRAFAAAAPPDHRLVFKLHPLENWRERFDRVVAGAAEAEGLAGRVLTLPEGDLGALIRRSEGVVVINSTVGLHALRAGKPVKPLGAALYAMEGLTDPRPLTAFFAAPRPPDPATTRALVATLARETQIRGDFYEPAGREAAAAEMARRIAEGRVGPSAWRARAAPPRLAALVAERRRRRAGPLPNRPAPGL